MNMGSTMESIVEIVSFIQSFDQPFTVATIQAHCDVRHQVVYTVLQTLEAAGLVSWELEHLDRGRPAKWYTWKGKVDGAILGFLERLDEEGEQ